MSCPNEHDTTRPDTDEGQAPPPADDAATDAAAEAQGDAGQAPPAADEAQAGGADAERRQLTERLQRLAADFSNYQKRMQRRLAEERREAVGNLVRDLLPVLDNFERALAAAEEKPDAQALYDGVRMVHDQWIDALTKHGVEPIQTAGQPFDPEHHEAVAHVPSDDMPTGHVIGEVQRGYRHGDRTLRASRVAVSSGPDDEAPPEGAPREAGETADDEPDRPGRKAEDHTP